MSSAVQGAHPVEGEKFPLILFSHGDGGVATQNLSQVEALVSNGYIVIAPNHTYNASITFDEEGTPAIYQSNITWSEQTIYSKKYYANQLIRYRYSDIAFILDEISKKMEALIRNAPKTIPKIKLIQCIAKANFSSMAIFKSFRWLLKAKQRNHSLRLLTNKYSIYWRVFFLVQLSLDHLHYQSCQLNS